MLFRHNSCGMIISQNDINSNKIVKGGKKNEKPDEI
jgi:hypothetical protein